MNITYATTNYEITESVQAYAEEKIQSLEKFVKETDSECRVEFEQEAKHHSGNIFRADMTIFAGKQKTHAVGHGASMQEALDRAKDELKLRLGKEKGRFMKTARHLQAKLKEIMKFQN